MKKDTVLGFIAVILLIFAFRALAEEYCPNGNCAYAERATEEASADIDCQKCCKGNFTSAECFKKCGSCMMYSDKAYAEAWDFPSND
jgi:hypothetical protein